jgi:hypothetical protein
MQLGQDQNLNRYVDRKDGERALDGRGIQKSNPQDSVYVGLDARAERWSYRPSAHELHS